MKINWEAARLAGRDIFSALMVLAGFFAVGLLSFLPLAFIESMDHPWDLWLGLLYIFTACGFGCFLFLYNIYNK